MNAVSHLLELQRELEQLDRLRRQLSEQLLDSAGRLDAPGEPPRDELIDDLVSYRARMLSLAGQLDDEAARPRDGREMELSFVRLEQLLSMRLRREEAARVLDDLLALRHVEIPDFAPLALCHAEARRLRDIASLFNGLEQDAELDALCQGKHPLNALLMLCERGGQLSDADWTACNDRVTETYGRQLATALARGRIQGAAPIQTASITPSEARTINPEVRPALPVSMIQPETAAISVALPPAISVKGAAPTESKLFVAEPAADSIFDPPPLADSVFSPPRPPQKLPSVASLTSSLFPSAREVEQPLRADKPHPSPNQSDPFAKASDIRSRVIQLVAEDRLALAIHLTRCRELQPGSSVLPWPTWLLRALALGRHLSYAKGEMARQVDLELRQFRPEILSEGDEDHRLAMGLMLRAAALAPALLAGSAPAATILRALKIAPGFSQLYNYCSRIAFYGDRLDGQIVEMLRPRGAERGDADMQALAQEASNWLQNAAQEAVGYARTSPLFLHAHWTLTAGTSVRHAEATYLWCKWQETLLLASRLLRPVCRGLEGERNTVKLEIARLTANVRVEEQDASQRNLAGGGSGSRAIVLPTEEMHRVLQEAIDLANRWLRVCAAKTSTVPPPLAQDALELRDEVRQRTDAVLGELRQLEQTTSSPLVRAGVTCCQRAVEQMRSLFEADCPLLLQEADHRHVLNAELLKLPGVELNEDWLPETEPAALERELIVHLDRDDCGWSEAFEQHLRNGNHAATGRLLELNVWDNPDERAQRQQQRETLINEGRATLQRELDDTLIELEVAAAEELLHETETTAFTNRLERMQADLPKLLNFGPFRLQLDQLRFALQRRRSQSGSSVRMSNVLRNAAMDARRERMTRLASASSITNTPEPAAQATDIFSGE